MAKVVGLDGKPIELPEEETSTKRDYLEEVQGFIQMHNSILQDLCAKKDSLTAEELDKAEIDIAMILHSANSDLLKFFVEKIEECKDTLVGSHDGSIIHNDTDFNMAYLREITLYIALSKAVPNFMQGTEDEIVKYNRMIDKHRKQIMKLVSIN